jgi:hypothetical protein
MMDAGRGVALASVGSRQQGLDGGRYASYRHRDGWGISDTIVKADAG